MKGHSVEEYLQDCLSSSWGHHIVFMNRLTEQLITENRMALRWLAHTRNLEGSLAWHRRELCLMNERMCDMGGMGRGKGKGGTNTGNGKGYCTAIAVYVG